MTAHYRRRASERQLRAVREEILTAAERVATKAESVIPLRIATLIPPPK